MWVKIPYEYEDYDKKSIVNKNNMGNFEFSFNTTLGTLTQLKVPIDKRYEGMLFFFPSKLTHCVYPFYSSADEERISISGNIMLDTLK
jgi:hypothetical protein